MTLIQVGVSINTHSLSTFFLANRESLKDLSSHKAVLAIMDIVDFAKRIVGRFFS
jgi:ABC-type uncharacterized transport system permease subunit